MAVSKEREIKTGLAEERKNFAYRDLAPIERAIVGGRLAYRGELMGGEDLLRRIAANENIGEDIFVPENVIADPKALDKSRKARQKKDHFSGVFRIFELEPQAELSDSDSAIPSLELSPLDSLGFVRPIWRVELRDEYTDREVKNQKKLKILSLVELAQQVFKLRYQDGTDELLLEYFPHYQNPPQPTQKV